MFLGDSRASISYIRKSVVEKTGGRNGCFAARLFQTAKDLGQSAAALDKNR